MLGGLIENLRQGEVKSFEEFYILTYDTLYSYAWILMGTQRDKAKELLINTYCYVYDYRGEIPEEDKVYAWLYKQMDEAAKNHFDITEEMIEEIRLQEEDHEAVIKLSEETAASILLMVEERLGLLEDQEEILSKRKKVFSGIKLVFACFFFSGTLWLLSLGMKHLTDQLSFLKNPLVETLPERIIMDSEEDKPKSIKIGDKIVYLSDIGQVLYSLPLEESELDDKTPYNPEIQETDQWEYYLPSPEREDSELSNISSQLIHSLYRMAKQSEEWELVAREVEDYIVFEGHIYVEQYDRIQVLEEEKAYETLSNRIVPELKEDGIYLYNLLGNSLPADQDGMVQFEDRLYSLEGNKISAVTAAEYKEGNRSWYLDHESRILYQNNNGTEEIFEKQKRGIDSFCRMGDWIYYSVYTRMNSSGKHFSQIFRKNIQGGASESVTKEFAGNIYNLYYSDESKLIFGEYVPESGRNQKGLLAVLTPEGILSTLQDPGEVSEASTDGQGYLRFIISYDTNVYCLWDEVPVMLSSQNRTPVK